MEAGEFCFENGRAGEFRFPLPVWLGAPAGVFRVNAVGTHDVEYALDSHCLMVRDQVHVAGMYVVVQQAGRRAEIDPRHADLLDAERVVGFDPGNRAEDLAALKALGL